MGVPTVNDEQNTLIQYVKDHLVDWMEEKRILPFPQSRSDVSPQLLERMVRVEEAIKFQNEKFDTLINRMDRRFDDMDRRFEAQRQDMDRRFEEIGRRFNRQGLYHLATFTAIVTSAVAILLNS